jgi:2-polyprenyl-3-methyl-5-hydroxy-6-metoxy-1,4-benzoquinol methylase
MAVEVESELKQYCRNARTQIAPLLPRAKGERCLDIGCGSGITLQWLKSQKICSWTSGIEVHNAAAEEAAKNLDEFFNLDVEMDSSPAFELSSFDVILCLDVLEHLKDPWTIIKKLHNLLTPQGMLIASIPNVRNIRVAGPSSYRVNGPMRIRGCWTKHMCASLRKNLPASL